MQTLLDEDLSWCICRLPSEVRDLMYAPGDTLCVAGGFVRACIAREEINDVDVFAPSAEAARLVAYKFAADKKVQYRETDNAITLLTKPLPIQFIHRWTFAKPEDVIPSFDFTIARAAFWFDKADVRWYSSCDDRFYADLAAKRLTYCAPARIEEAGGSLLRVLKFYQRGYRIPLDSLAKVTARLLVGLHGPEDKLPVLAEEADFGQRIEGLLKLVDPGVDPGHEAHLPSTKE
jgi:hypothetical protein